MIKFSLLVPTRERLNGIDCLLRSIIETAIEPETIEVLFVADEDDVLTLQRLFQITTQKEYSPLTIKTYSRTQSQYTNRDYYSWLCQYASGELLWPLADDLLLLIKDWDKIIWDRTQEYLKQFPDRIACFAAKDNTKKPKQDLEDFVCFPIFTKQCYEALSFILIADLPVWGADYSTRQLFYPLGRYIYIEPQLIFIQHVAWHTGLVPEDTTSRRIRKIFSITQHTPATNVDWVIKNRVPEYARQLQQYIREHSA